MNSSSSSRGFAKAAAAALIAATLGVAAVADAQESLRPEIGKPLQAIPEHKMQEILAIKRRMGLPDARMNDRPDSAAGDGKELDRLVEQVVARLEERR